MAWKHLLAAVLLAASMQGCNVSDAARVLVRGMPEPNLPQNREIKLTIFGGDHLNARFDGDVARPLRICAYFHQNEDWMPPIDLSAPCAEQDSKVHKAVKLILVPGRVAYVTDTVAYKEAMWVTVTGDFSGTGGLGVVKMESPARVDSCHWLNIDRNQISEMKKNGSGQQPTCK